LRSAAALSGSRRESLNAGPTLPGPRRALREGLVAAIALPGPIEGDLTATAAETGSS